MVMAGMRITCPSVTGISLFEHGPCVTGHEPPTAIRPSPERVL
jgi:hypothetical protein